MKTIKVLSEELGISKEAIYKKIKFQLKDQLADHITKLNSVTQIDSIGEQFIIQSLNRERQESIQDIIDIENVQPSSNKQIPQSQPHLTEYISLLKDQVKTKDIQLEMQCSHITQLINQLGNNQFLLKTEQFKNVLQLQTELAATQEHIKKNSIWKKIFKR